MTTFNTFTPNTVIQSSKINENFQNALNVLELQKAFNKIPVATAVTSSSGAFDLDAGSVFKRTMDGTNGTISVTNEDTDQIFFVELIQGASGSNLATWFSGIKWANGGTAPTLTTTVGKKDVFAFRVTSAGAYDGYIVGQNI